MAMFFFSTLKNSIGKWGWLFFAWATAICYAQLYVAVHYPTDIICGALIGLLIGFVSGKLFNNKWGLA